MLSHAYSDHSLIIQNLLLRIQYHKVHSWAAIYDSCSPHSTSNYHLRKGKKHTLLIRFDFLDSCHLGPPSGFNFQKRFQNSVKHSEIDLFAKIVSKMPCLSELWTLLQCFPYLELGCGYKLHTKYIRKKESPIRYRVHFTSTT